ncbi:MAG: PD40 domain-containing protein [Saprospiraceae bacterium]|nr:PD40 domain-containing protein [Saprospiraceae bacterium]
MKQTATETVLPSEQVLQSLGLDSFTVADAAEPAYGPQTMRLDKNVNTHFSDFAPFRYGERLYFTTVKLDGTGRPTVNQVFSSLINGQPVAWSENSKQVNEQTMHTTMTADSKHIYYTVCKNDQSGKQECEILTRERAFEGHWLPAKRIKSVNMDGFTSTQPSIGFDFTLRKEVLYFASDRPGGKGGLDIWCSTIESNGVHGAPTLMPFNSPQDDVTPFFYQQGQVLFFSSRRQSGTGFDIYRVQKTNKGWSEAKPLSTPFNSPYNDTYFTCHQPSGKSYFCSDRPGCTSPDTLTSCVGYDIFESELPVELEVKALLANGNALLEDASITVSNAANGTVIQPSGDSRHHFYLKIRNQYKISVTASGYSTEAFSLETSPSDVFTTIEKTVRLRQNAKIIIQTFDALDSLPTGGADFVFSSSDGGAPVTHQNDKTTSQHELLVAFGNDSKLMVSKPGYEPTTFSFDAMTAAGPSAVMNLKVYLKPFDNLPIVLFFDNDQPRWVQSPFESESKMTYEQVLQQYLERKPFFVEKYSEGLAQEFYETARLNMESFFEKEVGMGLRQLDELCAQLLPFLKKGIRLELLVESQTSLLAGTDYNQKLADRRISTLRNYLKVWQNGAIKPYLYSGKLVITNQYAQLPAPSPTDAAQPQDRRSLEFSPEASRMRRIVIKEVRRLGLKV